MVEPFPQLKLDTTKSGHRPKQTGRLWWRCDAKVLLGERGGLGVVVCGRLVFLFLVLLAGPQSAQSSSLKGYLVESWGSERGLPQNTVTGIAQTRDGYLWISTLD